MFGNGERYINFMNNEFHYPKVAIIYLSYNPRPYIDRVIKSLEKTTYPKEKIEIVDAYNHFVEWAESNGILYPDWYQNNPGYREDSNIY